MEKYTRSEDKTTIILLDPGHGSTTPGKRSPDGALLEWEYTRALADKIVVGLQERGYNAQMLFESDEDVPLNQRIAMANSFPKDSTLLISIHLNAAGDGTRWHCATGFSAFVAPNAGVRSRRLAQLLTQEAVAEGLSGNRSTPACGYWTASLAICRHTHCPAVLTENLFMDSQADLALLSNPATLDRLAQVHTRAIIKFLNS